jgi:hypothetical protein
MSFDAALAWLGQTTGVAGGGRTAA